MEDHRWKEMRTKLTPTFTSGRIKAMFPLVQECADALEKHLGTLADTGEEFDIKVGTFHLPSVKKYALQKTDFVRPI